MTNIMLIGANGKMGRVISRCIDERGDCKVIAGVDLDTTVYSDFPIYESPEKCNAKVDVIIDFSNPAALDGLLSYAKSHGTPIVIATTGYTPEQSEVIREASKEIPVFFSFNMSLGINLLAALAKKATEVLGGQFDIEIVEKHHNQKIDAPSGTALLLADAINDTMDNSFRYMYDRHSQRKKRSKNEIGIHAIRGGTIVGEHEIVFAGHDEVIKLSHQAMSKEIFAVGSINAAVYMDGKPAGLYDMSQLALGNQ